MVKGTCTEVDAPFVSVFCFLLFLFIATICGGIKIIFNRDSVLWFAEIRRPFFEFNRLGEHINCFARHVAT